MQIANLTLAYLVEEIKPFIEGAFVNKVQELAENCFKFSLHSKEGSKELVIVPEALFLTQHRLQAAKRQGSFSVFLRKRLYNKKILSLSQHEIDRLLVIEFQEYFLILELFGEGNIILCNKDLQIIFPLHSQEWKDRIVKKGQQYKFPASKGLNPANLSPQQLSQVFMQSSQPAINQLISSLNIAPLLAEEAFHKAGIPKSTQSSSLNPEQISRLCSAISSIYSVSLELLSPCICNNTLLPFKVSCTECTEASSLNEAIDSHYSKTIFLKEFKEEDSETSAKKLALQKSLEEQLRARAGLQEAAELNRKKGEAIYAHSAEIIQLIEEIKNAQKKGFSEKAINEKLLDAKNKNLPLARIFGSLDQKRKKLQVEL